MRRILIGFALLVSMAGCESSLSEEDAESSTPRDYAAEFSKGKEARAWMAAGTNHMFEASDETCKTVIEELYKRGAQEVRVTDGDKLDENSTGETAVTLMAKLPPDPAKRSELFKYEQENTEDADTDQKRDYVEIVFD